MKGFLLFRQAITWIIEFFLAAGIIAAIITLSGCNQKQTEQPHYRRIWCHVKQEWASK